MRCAGESAIAMETAAIVSREDPLMGSPAISFLKSPFPLLQIRHPAFWMHDSDGL